MIAVHEIFIVNDIRRAFNFCKFICKEKDQEYNPNSHRRRSIRLPHWDYAWAWWYYVTKCVKDRHCLMLS